MKKVAFNTPIGRKVFTVNKDYSDQHSPIAPGLFVSNTGKFDIISPSESHGAYEDRLKIRRDVLRFIAARYWVGDKQFLPSFWLVCTQRDVQKQKKALVYFAQAVLDYWPDTEKAVQICPCYKMEYWTTIDRLATGYIKETITTPRRGQYAYLTI